MTESKNQKQTGTGGSDHLLRGGFVFLPVSILSVSVSLLSRSAPLHPTRGHVTTAACYSLTSGTHCRGLVGAVNYTAS